ncbi:cytoplasmic protein [Candidatus Methylacidithermus pantelleriae]|uniref:Cytoplasmic protein n=1 Tax=Candidatus Methylacidithermus pantelleriae TaxID=2744239 RepID=A0A8J2FVV8_9BACT|nr:cytoplasmic protein [Candidatus Methylacidithermus pantelleriae]CAF0695909.1 hypothetical protein MPNT_20052 [Candidatus Methylacidithermus pantelleriae]
MRVGIAAQGISQRRQANPGQFDTLRASFLYCPRCQGARPVRERLLLVLPDREIYEYLCSECGEGIGKREVGPGAGDEGPRLYVSL